MTDPVPAVAKKRIVQVCNSGFYLTGFLRPLVAELVERGWDVHCICNFSERDRLALEQKIPGATLHHASFPSKPSPFRFATSILALYRQFRELRPDVVNSHNRNASIAARVAAFFSRVPCNVYTAHGFYFHDGQGSLKHSLAVGVERVLAWVTHYTLSQSADDTAFAIGSGLCPRDAIETIGNGIDLDRFSPPPERDEATRRSGDFHIASTGRLVAQKGFQDLVMAVDGIRSQVPGVRLTLIGGNIEQEIDPFRAELERLIVSRGLSGVVTITGLTNEVPKYLADADLFVLPSYREGLPRSLIEAMSMALPVVATDIRGCRECIIPGENGYLFRAGDVNTLAGILVRIARSTDRRAFGRSSRRLALKRFGEKEYVMRQVDAVDRVARARSRVES